MDIKKLTDNSNVLALLSGEKGLYDFSKKDQKEAISILNDSPSLMMKYLSLDLDDEIDLELYTPGELEELLSPKFIEGRGSICIYLSQGAVFDNRLHCHLSILH